MKKVVVLALCALLLTGCSGAAEEIQRGMQLRSALLGCSHCSFDVEVTADYGDALHRFSLECGSDSQGDLRFTVTQPESIAGIQGTIAHGTGKLTFPDTAVQFDLMADDQLSPVSGPWILLNGLRSGHLQAAGMEGELLRLSLADGFEEDALYLDVWLNGQNQPIRGEVLYDGRRILSMEVSGFQIV